jgi:hypothetical protein
MERACRDLDGLLSGGLVTSRLASKLARRALLTSRADSVGT